MRLYCLTNKLVPYVIDGSGTCLCEEVQHMRAPGSFLHQTSECDCMWEKFTWFERHALFLAGQNLVYTCMIAICLLWTGDRLSLPSLTYLTSHMMKQSSRKLSQATGSNSLLSFHVQFEEQIFYFYMTFFCKIVLIALALLFNLIIVCFFAGNVLK